MKKKFIQNILAPYMIPALVIMLIASIAISNYSTWLGVASLVLMALTAVYWARLTDRVIVPKISEHETQLLQDNDQVMFTLAQNESLPLCTINEKGKISWQNACFNKVCEENGPLDKMLGGEGLSELFTGEKTVNLHKAWGDRVYHINCTQVGGTSPKRLLVFTDITTAEKTRQLFRDRKCCAAYLSVDNYDEIIADTPAEDQSSAEAAIDRCIRSWAAEMEAAVSRFRAGNYVIFFEQRYLDALKENRFKILNELHEIVTGADFPTSASIGVAFESADLGRLQDEARQALDLALGRGGDQAVIKRLSGENEYYGGTLQTVEKRNKGKSRMVAHALLQQMNTADKIVIMGHSRPDMDSFGSAIGLYSLAESSGKETVIVLNSSTEAIQHIYAAAKQTGHFNIMPAAEILPLITPDTLLIVTDCHAGFMTESADIVSAAQRIVIIDHHRRSKSAIENATLVHTEVYASSASELVTELLQYSGKNSIDKFAANALLAGITVDTKNFTVNTGVRTFEAASWLRRNGADSAEVKKFFKMRLDFVQKKYNIIASAEVLGDGIAVAYTKQSDDSMQVMAAQAADELLEMQGVRAAFTAGVGKTATMISARSSGQINVQTIMEKMGGGGHMNVAAAQVKEGPEEAIQRVVQLLREDNIIS